jgi:hypothetical protein
VDDLGERSFDGGDVRGSYDRDDVNGFSFNKNSEVVNVEVLDETENLEFVPMSCSGGGDRMIQKEFEMFDTNENLADGDFDQGFYSMPISTCGGGQENFYTEKVVPENLQTQNFKKPVVSPAFDPNDQLIFNINKRLSGQDLNFKGLESDDHERNLWESGNGKDGKGSGDSDRSWENGDRSNYHSPKIMSLGEFSDKKTKNFLELEGQENLSKETMEIDKNNTESHKKIRTLINSTNKKINPAESWVATTQLKKLKDDNESLVEEYRKFEQELRMKIKENKQFKTSVLANQKGFKAIKRACDEADDSILELQVKHDDLLEEFRKNLTLDSDSSFVSKQNHNFSSNMFGNNHPESADGTSASLEPQLSGLRTDARQNFSSAFQNSNSNFNTSQHNPQNPMFHSNNSPSSNPGALSHNPHNRPQNPQGHERFKSLNPTDAQNPNIKDHSSTFFKNQQKKFAENPDPISRKVKKNIYPHLKKKGLRQPKQDPDRVLPPKLRKKIQKFCILEQPVFLKHQHLQYQQHRVKIIQR